MSQLIKRWVSRLLKPLASLVQAFSLVKRIWAHAYLAARIKSPLDASVVVLGCPEVHGTGHIRLGKNLFLYRELYLETQEEGEISLGDEVVLSRGVHVVAFSTVRIGNGTMIGEYSSIRDANHQFKSGTALRHAGHVGAPITIGEQVWIGRGSRQYRPRGGHDW